MFDLDSMLKRAATADGWTRVIHRCAACKRVFDERGQHTVAVVPNEAVVTTDGLCPPCGIRALAHITARRQRRQLRAA